MVDSDLMMDEDLMVDVNSLVDASFIEGANLGILKVLVNLIRKYSPSYATCTIKVQPITPDIPNVVRNQAGHLVEFFQLHSMLIKCKGNLNAKETLIRRTLKFEGLLNSKDS